MLIQVSLARLGAGFGSALSDIFQTHDAKRGCALGGITTIHDKHFKIMSVVYSGSAP